MKTNCNLRTLLSGTAAVAVGIIAFSGAAAAQNRHTASADAEARIVSGIAIEKNRDMNFGSIVRSAAGGTVVLNANTGAVTFNGVTQGQTRNNQTAQFTTTGEPEYHYTISLPRTATLSRQGGSGSMEASDFVTSEDSGELDRNGREQFTVGATLRVSPNQATGTYKGSFEVAVQYQ